MTETSNPQKNDKKPDIDIATIEQQITQNDKLLKSKEYIQQPVIPDGSSSLFFVNQMILI